MRVAPVIKSKSLRVALVVLHTLSLSACTSVPARANEKDTPVWKWQGFEVFGNHKIAKAEIQELIPIHAGDIYQEAPDAWKQWCGVAPDYTNTSSADLTASCPSPSFWTLRSVKNRPSDPKNGLDLPIH